MHDGKEERLNGIVTGITGFGAFVKLEDGKTGLIHISQVSDQYVRDVHDFLSIGQEVTVRILSVDEKGRIALSTREPKCDSDLSGQPCYFEEPTPPSDFELMLSHYKCTSEEKLSDLHRSQHGGRSSSKRRKKV